jgi:molybdate transport system substrate-binding protein
MVTHDTRRLKASGRGRVRRATVIVVAVLAGVVAEARELKVMTSGAFTAAYLDLEPTLERALGETLTTLAITMGTGPDYIPTRLQRGEDADVVIVADAALEQMLQGGLVVAKSKVPLARSAIGMVVRAGAPKPDISSVDALRTALVNARSIAYSASVSGDYLVTELFPRLGVAEQVKEKSRRIERERVAAVVARGEAELGFQQISELLPVPGVDYVGPLPAEVQRITVFSAGVIVHSKNQSAANALIAFLASPKARDAIKRSGLEPIAR